MPSQSKNKMQHRLTWMTLGSTGELATVMKCGSSWLLEPSAKTGKYRWCLRMTMTSTSLQQGCRSKPAAHRKIVP